PAPDPAAPTEPAPPPPIPGAEPADALIAEGETRFLHLWKVTSGGENAEAYWNSAGDRLVLQRRDPAAGVECDRIFVTDAATGALVPVSDGRGVTTCAYFLPDDAAVVYASTRAAQEDCPPPPDRSQGYVWELHADYELYRQDLATGEVVPLTDLPGYDAEATVSPLGDRIVFTSTRSGEPELWTSDLQGGDLRQVTDAPGYDGGAFFSHDGTQLVFRTTHFDPGQEAEQIAEFRALLERGLVRPSAMEIHVVGVDGSNRRQVTDLGGANWAPYFLPDDSGIVFSTNHHVPPRSRNFDLFLSDLEGGALERVTTYDGFDAFPMFSPDGRYLAFSSNRGGATEGETNVFVALWRE
ncbi:MAG TPA: hypothetical protein VJP77_07865, partial [Planctomycetota bacterium]|nr:hypothetical protein [Planctomycetota bacterium]